MASPKIDDAQKQKLLTTLKKYFGHSDFRSPTQLEAIAEVMTRINDVFVSMPTGSGKSLIFQLPSLVSNDPKITHR